MNSFSDAVAHLHASDPAISRVIARVGACQFDVRSEGSHFDAIVRAIVYQQLSGKAAGTIYNRLLALAGHVAPLPHEILALEDEKLRSVGLSRQKIAYIKHLAALVTSGALDIENLASLEDEQIIATLAQVRGVGRWTAQMFLIFRLGRPDVMPEGDLGIRKGIQLADGLDRLPTPAEVLERARPWRPYCTIASWYLWRSLE